MSFIVNGIEVDFDGNPVKGSKAQATESTQANSDLPDDFPARDLLIGTSFTTLDALNAASDDDLLAVDGIGPATLKQIRAAKKG